MKGNYSFLHNPIVLHPISCRVACSAGWLVGLVAGQHASLLLEPGPAVAPPEMSYSHTIRNWALLKFCIALSFFPPLSHGYFSKGILSWYSWMLPMAFIQSQMFLFRNVHCLLVKNRRGNLQRVRMGFLTHLVIVEQHVVPPLHCAATGSPNFGHGQQWGSTAHTRSFFPFLWSPGCVTPAVRFGSPNNSSGSALGTPRRQEGTRVCKAGWTASQRCCQGTCSSAPMSSFV